MAAAKHTELPAVVVPPHLWTRSGRPVQGRVVQVVLPGALIVAGLLADGAALRVGLVLAGLGLFLALPAMVLARLERLGREIQRADARTAAQLLHSVPNKPVVQFFAPLAWRTLQEGILQLKTGDGKAAAANFVETARLVRQPEAVMLISAQAHALVVAGERAEARELLQKLAKENLLGSRDQLDLGIVLLIETKKSKQALAYIEAARKTIGDHPRVLAAMALALQKTERIDEASELLEQVQIALQGGEADPVVADLVKRARKGLEAFIEAQLRRERRSRSRRTTIVVSSDLAASEIVSGEIGAGDQAQLDNPTTSFRPVEAAPSVISSKSVDGELTNQERTMLNLPDSRIRRAEEARASAFSIEEDAVEEIETVGKTEPSPAAAPVAKAPVAPVAPAMPVAPPVATGKPESEPVSASLFESVLTELFETNAPAKPNGQDNISLINPAVAARPPSVPSQILSSLPPLTPPTPPSPPPPARPAAEVDVPMVRRKQTLAAPLGNLPTGGPPPLSGLPIAGGGKSSLPTRRPDASSAAPKTTTPLFRAPGAKSGDGKPDDDER
jgi:tetratricopeptide (TPR) repeat protein